MTDKTPIDRLYDDATSIAKIIEEKGELSLSFSASDNLRKTVLLAAASHFEHKICTYIIEFVRETSKGNKEIEKFVQNKAIARQYHTLFEWDRSNANKFYSLFGDGFKEMMTERIRLNNDIDDAVRAFLEIGAERNKLVHQDYATVALDKTLDEIYSLYKKAEKFVDALPISFRDAADSSDQKKP